MLSTQSFAHTIPDISLEGALQCIFFYFGKTAEDLKFGIVQQNVFENMCLVRPEGPEGRGGRKQRWQRSTCLSQAASKRSEHNVVKL
jgi:hypothetical protein